MAVAQANPRLGRFVSIRIPRRRQKPLPLNRRCCRKIPLTTYLYRAHLIGANIPSPNEHAEPYQQLSNG